MVSELKEKATAFFGKHAKKIALVTGAIFIFVGGIALGGGGGGLGANLSASLADAWGFTKDAFSRVPVAEYRLESGAENTGGADTESLKKKECDFDADVEAGKNVFISEVAWMGSHESYRAEWIEFTNPTDKTISLAGWKLEDESGKLSFEFPVSAEVPPRGFYVIAKKGSSVMGEKPSGEFSGSIRNSDQTLKLFDTNCVARDGVVADPSWPAGDNDTKQTMERNWETLAWHTSTADGGTPGKENSVGTPMIKTVSSKMVPQQNLSSPTSSKNIVPAVAGTSTEPVPEVIVPICTKRDGAVPTREILINEVAWAGTGSDKTSHEWIELYNRSNADISMDGWQIMNRSRALRFVFPNRTVPAGGFVLLERTDDETVPDIDADAIYVGALKNSDESLQLFDDLCNLSDEAEASVGSTKAWPAGTTSPEYRSMERGEDLLWHSFSGATVNGIFGTPKMQNTKGIGVGLGGVATTGLAVSKTGTGSGMIFSDPAGIVCGSVCSYFFQKDTAVTLSATPDPDSRFMGWGGCVGSVTCSIALDGTMEIAGEFQKVSAPLPVAPPPPASAPATGHVVIEKLQVSGSSANDEYVSIFNPTTSATSLAGWSVQYRGSGASSFSKKNFESTHSIAPGASFVIAHSQYAQVVSADMTHSSFAFSATGGTVFLVSTTTLLVTGVESTVVDKLAYGSGTYLFPEGLVFSEVPPASQVLARKNTAGTPQDTDNNSVDFEIK